MEKKDTDNKCLIKPKINDLHSFSQLSQVSNKYVTNPSIIYSEPQLSCPSSFTNPTAAYSNMVDASTIDAFSESALQQIGIDTSSAIMDPDHECSSACTHPTSNSDRNSKFNSSCRDHTHKSACFFYSGSQPSIVTNITNPGSAVGYSGGHKQSFSTREIREQHLLIQRKYRPLKKKGNMNPIDFEGILNIIGGCSWWQIWIYLLISFQQIPHAMFNLSVVYMMYQPDHWCLIPGLNGSSPDFKWDITDAIFNSSVLVPKSANTQRDLNSFHSQCYYFNRTAERFAELRRMTLEDAEKAVEVENVNASFIKCEKWVYKDDVMRKTIVTEWNLVCDNNFKRAHGHLFYSIGFLFGCCLGGFASDRFGRKPTIIGFGVLSSMFGLILPYSSYFPMFLFIRFCGAICNEAADLAAYILCMEITGTKYRSMVGSMLQAPWAIGYSLLALIAYMTRSWKSIQLITAMFHAISICLVCALPESPRWLIVNNRVEEAERYIRKACRDPPYPLNRFRFNKSSLPCDLELVRHTEQDKWLKENQRASIMHILKSSILLRRAFVLCVIWIAVALVYYGLIIALSDQSAPGRVLFIGNYFLNNAIAGAIELPTLIGCVVLLKFGRKKSQMITLIGASIAIFVAMTAVYNKNQMFSLFFMLISKVFIQSAFNILYIFTSELSPTNVRNSALGVYSMIGRIGSGASSYLAILSDVTLAVVPMIIFAIFSLIAGILVIFLPETKGLPLPETFADALLLTKNSNGKYGFYGLSENKSSASLVGKESGDGTSTIVAPIADPENQIQTEKGSTGSSLARRSETFTELAPITEDHEEGLHEPDSDRPKSSRSITPTQADFDAPGNLSRRQRHAAGSVERKVSAIEVSTNLLDKQEKEDKTTKFLISSSPITDD